MPYVLVIVPPFFGPCILQNPPLIQASFHGPLSKVSISRSTGNTGKCPKTSLYGVNPVVRFFKILSENNTKGKYSRHLPPDSLHNLARASLIGLCPHSIIPFAPG
ncbi:hypothetical protein PGT21_050267 [Puccinia graminis f. sp. tritici]|uniref:Uncharacterized protein n=1 Tax=Puccinia graminis f. sp. tritici TaxID=56615 RepID=A0A5B0N479_PUCGR|nr:hypothetical protein PGT21_050267 [Puccinia graminis f. sp. tritici]